jgi:hypothetical protein
MDGRASRYSTGSGLELADQPGREATLARFEAARAVSGSTVVKFKPNQVEVVAVALHVSKSPTAVSALRVLERRYLCGPQGR